jgi:hypothetical protein
MKRLLLILLLSGTVLRALAATAKEVIGKQISFGSKSGRVKIKIAEDGHIQIKAPEDDCGTISGQIRGEPFIGKPLVAIFCVAGAAATSDFILIRSPPFRAAYSASTRSGDN